MNNLINLQLGLGTLPLLTNAKTRSISAENPKGEVGSGAKETPDEKNPASKLGKGWKVRPCITLAKGSTTTLAEINGPGIIQHIWMTVDPKAYRDCVLRFFWDDEPSPSVEVPLGDFFANGHALRYNVNSLPVAVNPTGGFNCYWSSAGNCGSKFSDRIDQQVDSTGVRDIQHSSYHSFCSVCGV